MYFRSEVASNSKCKSIDPWKSIAKLNIRMKKTAAFQALYSNSNLKIEITKQPCAFFGIKHFFADKFSVYQDFKNAQ